MYRNRTRSRWSVRISGRVDGHRLCVVLVGVSVDEKASAYAAFVKKQAPPFPALHDVAQQLVRAVVVPAMPTTYIIGRDGKVRSIHAGYHGATTAQLLRTELDALLAEKS